MYPFRLITPVLLAALAGCASGEAMVAAAPAMPAPEVAAPVDTVPPAPVVEPDAPLEQRWAAPFAVQSVGQLAARDPRPAVVRLETADSAATRPARPDTVPLDTVPVDSASARPPATPRPRADSTRTATRPARPTSGAAAPSGRSGTTTRRSHEVKPGETFYGVARKFDVTPAALRAANPGVDPETLRSGTTLWIPSVSAASSSSTTRSGESRGSSAASRPAAKSGDAPRSGSSSTARAGRRTHTVVRGDTLFGIARKYGVTAAAIRTANKLEDDNVKLGATLVIPAS